MEEIGSASNVVEGATEASIEPGIDGGEIDVDGWLGSVGAGVGVGMGSAGVGEAPEDGAVSSGISGFQVLGRRATGNIQVALRITP